MPERFCEWCGKAGPVRRTCCTGWLLCEGCIAFDEAEEKRRAEARKKMIESKFDPHIPSPACCCRRCNGP